MGASRSISLEHLGEHLSLAKERLSVEKKEILKNNPLPEGFNREEYVFAYLRAEREGMQAIHARLSEIAWLPMQLDPHSELVTEHRNPMKRWLGSNGGGDPSASDFGNDFIHALTRAAVCHGASDNVSKKLMQRIAGLFRDLSCLIGMIYYATWLAERNVEGIALSDPDDLHRSVVEIAAIVQSPDLQRALRLRAETLRKAKAKKTLEKPAKSRPLLHIIRNENFGDHHAMTDPLLV